MRWILAGWALFIASALFFIAASWRARDMLALSGSVLFLVACLVFLVPIVIEIAALFRKRGP